MLKHYSIGSKSVISINQPCCLFPSRQTTIFHYPQTQNSVLFFFGTDIAEAQQKKKERKTRRILSNKITVRQT